MGCAIAAEVCSMSTGKEKEERTTRTPQVAEIRGVLGFRGKVKLEVRQFFEI